MTISPSSLHHWLNHFYGYGSWGARFWFVAYEEGGGDLPEEVAEKFGYFERVHPSANPTLCDVRDLYSHVALRWEGPKAASFDTLYDYRFGPAAVLHGVWKNLIAFTHGYVGNTIPDLLAYQRERFASHVDHTEALIRLYPLPSSHNHAWYYSWLDMPEFPFLKRRALYQEHVYQQRIQAILQQMSVHKPEVVLMYGMNNINALKDSVRAVFPSAKFRMIKAVPRQIPQHHLADLGGTRMVITTQIPALRHNRIETGFEWETFGRTIRGQM